MPRKNGFNEVQKRIALTVDAMGATPRGVFTLEDLLRNNAELRDMHDANPHSVSTNLAALTKAGLIKNLGKRRYRLLDAPPTVRASRKPAKTAKRATARRRGRKSRAATGPLPPPPGRMSLIEQRLAVIEQQLGKLIQLWA